jgi:hypothetical protein
MGEEHTLKTPSAEWMGTPPQPETDCKAKYGATPMANLALDQTKPVRSPHVPEENLLKGGVPARAEAGERETLESVSAIRPEAPSNVEVQDSNEIGPKTSLSGPRQTESEAALNTEATPNPEGPSISRFRSAFEVLSRGFLGHLMEAIKNLIPEGFLGGAEATSPERIAQGIMISHYQVEFFIQLSGRKTFISIRTVF